MSIVKRLCFPRLPSQDIGICLWINEKSETDVTSLYAFLPFSAVSVQTVAVFLPPVDPDSQAYVPFSTVPVVISKPVVILYLLRILPPQIGQHIHSVLITVVTCLSSSEKPYQLALQGH